MLLRQHFYQIVFWLLLTILSIITGVAVFLLNRTLRKHDENENFLLKKIEQHETGINDNVKEIAELSKQISESVISVHKIEESLPLALYKYEWEVLGEGKDKNKYYPFSHIELWIPKILGAMYFILVIIFIC